MKVEILTTPGCSNCKELEQMLNNLEISYNLIDVTEKTRIFGKISNIYCARFSHRWKITIYGNSEERKPQENLLLNW